jgi:hypothetical protein
MRRRVVLILLGLLSLYHCRGQGLVPAAGSNATTLVLFTAKRAAFTLANHLELLNAQLRRVQTALENVPVTSANRSNALSADYVVVLCPEPVEQFPAELLTAITQRRNPTLWVGHAVANQPTNVVLWSDSAAATGFGEVSLKFYGIQSVPPSQLLLRIEDYHCRSNHREFRRMADLLFWRRISFAVGVLPEYEGCGLEPDSEFVNSLKYAQRRGGRLVLKLPDTFWDSQADRPANSNLGEIRDLIERFRSHGLVLHAWENFGAAPPRKTAAEITRAVPVRIGTIRVSDATANDEFMPLGIVKDQIGVTIPDNLGYVSPDSLLLSVSAAARELFASRGAAGSFAFHAYLPFSTLAATLDELGSWNVAFLDLAKLKE